MFLLGSRASLVPCPLGIGYRGGGVEYPGDGVSGGGVSGG